MAHSAAAAPVRARAGIVDPSIWWMGAGAVEGFLRRGVSDVGDVFEEREGGAVPEGRLRTPQDSTSARIWPTSASKRRGFLDPDVEAVDQFEGAGVPQVVERRDGACLCWSHH
jgi:hypothetical protein